MAQKQFDVIDGGAGGAALGQFRAALEAAAAANSALMAALKALPPEQAEAFAPKVAAMFGLSAPAQAARPAPLEVEMGCVLPPSVLQRNDGVEFIAHHRMPVDGFPAGVLIGSTKMRIGAEEAQAWLDRVTGQPHVLVREPEE